MDNSSFISQGKIPNFASREIEGDYFSPENSATHFLISPIARNKVSLFAIFIILVFLIFIVKIFFLQVVETLNYQKAAEKNYLKTQDSNAPRGLIYDRNHKLIVKNQPKFSLSINPAQILNDENYEKNWEKAQEILKTSDGLPTSNERVIKKKISYEQALLFLSDPLHGFEVIIESEREYLDNNSMSHILGYLGKISEGELKTNPSYSLSSYTGKEGIEFFYETQLKGDSGLKKIEIDKKSKQQKIVAQEDYVPAKDLVLTVDLDLQEKAKSILEKYLTSRQLHAGAIIILDPRNGEILSLVNYPDYSNSSIQDAKSWQKIVLNPYYPLLNRAISGLYPSGSVIKPVMALAGLEEKIITPQTKILSTGGIRYGNWFYADWKVGGHGLANIFDALAWSINTFFYYVGGGYGNFVGLGPERIAEYLKKVGLDATTNIDLPGERKGRVPDPEWKEKTKGEPWFIGDTYHLSIGQGDLLVTPLQVAYYTSLIANYGTAYQPHLVQKIVDPQSSETNLVTPNIQVKNIFKPENILVVRQGMREAVQRGSAMNLSSLPFTAAGKTGTAQVSYKQPHAWFTGFAPFDQPEIVVTVLLENGGEGSALPVQMTKEIMQYYFSRPE